MSGGRWWTFRVRLRYLLRTFRRPRPAPPTGTDVHSVRVALRLVEVSGIAITEACTAARSDMRSTGVVDERLTSTLKSISAVAETAGQFARREQDRLGIARHDSKENRT